MKKIRTSRVVKMSSGVLPLKGKFILPPHFVLAESVSQARRGSRDAAFALLKQFGDEASKADKVLIEYVAECLRTWSEVEFDTRKVAHAFRFSRHKSRPPLAATQKRHVKVIEMYLRLRGKGARSGQAASKTAEECNYSEKNVEKLIAGLHDKTTPLTEAQTAALMQIDYPLRKWKLPRNSDSLATDRGSDMDLERALGLGWNKWRSYKEDWFHRGSQRLLRLQPATTSSKGALPKSRS